MGAPAGAAARLGRALAAGVYPGGSGPAVAWAFQRAFAAVTVVAWASLASQVKVLIGAQGLLPLRPLLEQLRAGEGVPLLEYPSLLRWPALAGDRVLVAGTMAGLLLGLLALAGWRPRLCFGLSTFLYLGYAAACRTFLAFQWDNLLLECGLLCSLLPGSRPAPLCHLALRLLLFKLYFESGLAKWQSPAHDWHDGSAMTLYYETAPLPTALAWYAHNLPAWWHHLESRATLVLELVVPLGCFGPRRARLVAAATFTVFQALNMATANYGFFCPLAAALGLFLLDDRDVEAVLARARRLLPARVRERLLPSAPAAAPPAAAPGRLHRVLAGVGLGAFVALSALEAVDRFGPQGPWQDALLPVQHLHAPLRLVNTYHLFASITRERIEPGIEILAEEAGAPAEGAWIAYDLWHKAGDPLRPPDLVAPHQPRVDFQLWFYGLAWQRRAPAYVDGLLQRLCQAPRAVQALFRAPLPARPAAVRMAFHRYTFTSTDERRATGQVWRRILLGTSPVLSCDRYPP
jgi:hypothetical protein